MSVATDVIKARMTVLEGHHEASVERASRWSVRTGEGRRQIATECDKLEKLEAKLLSLEFVLAEIEQAEARS